MSKAYKCDGCGGLIEGDPPELKDYKIELGDLQVYYAFGRRPNEQEIAAMNSGSDVLHQIMTGHSHTTTDSVRADVCQGCQDKLLRLALERLLMELPQ